MQENILDIIKSNFSIIITSLNGLILSAIAILGNGSMKNKEYKISFKQAKVNKINNELKEFYYPMLLLIRKNKILYNIFKYSQDANAHTLIDLLLDKNYNTNDKELLFSIIEIDREINKLIISNMGIVDGDIGKELANASVHFTIMSMAYEGKITGEIDRFKESTYPIKLQELIEEQVEFLIMSKEKLTKGS